MLEQREKVGKLCKAVDIRERPSLRKKTKNRKPFHLLVSQTHKSQIATLHAPGICGYQNAQFEFQV